MPNFCNRQPFSHHYCFSVIAVLKCETAPQYFQKRACNRLFWSHPNKLFLVSFQVEEHAEAAGGERCWVWRNQKESGFHSVVTRGSLPRRNKVDYSRIICFWKQKLISWNFRKIFTPVSAFIQVLASWFKHLMLTVFLITSRARLIGMHRTMTVFGHSPKSCKKTRLVLHF